MATNPQVDIYISQAAPFAQPILRHFRKVVHEGCPEVEESIKWQRATFVFRGKILCLIGAFQAHFRIRFWDPEMSKLLAQDGVKSMDRVASIADLPNDKNLLRYVRAAAASIESGSRTVRKSERGPTAAVPEDFVAALRKNEDAFQRFERLSRSHRREYISWISEAKRTETRERRISKALEQLTERSTRESGHPA